MPADGSTFQLRPRVTGGEDAQLAVDRVADREALRRRGKNAMQSLERVLVVVAERPRSSSGAVGGAVDPRRLAGSDREHRGRPSRTPRTSRNDRPSVSAGVTSTQSSRGRSCGRPSAAPRTVGEALAGHPTPPFRETASMGRGSSGRGRAPSTPSRAGRVEVFGPCRCRLPCPFAGAGGRGHREGEGREEGGEEEGGGAEGSESSASGQPAGPLGAVVQRCQRKPIVRNGCTMGP